MCEYCQHLFETDEPTETLYQTGTYNDLLISRFDNKSILLVKNKKQCPAFAKCSAKNIAPKTAFVIHFCPECGRKLDGKEDKE